MFSLYEHIDHDLNFYGETKLIANYISPKNSKMHLKNISGKRLLVLSFNIRSPRKDFQSSKCFVLVHGVKSVVIRSYSGPHFSSIFPHSEWMWRNTLYLSVFSPNAGKCGKNADQNNSEYGHFLCSTKIVSQKYLLFIWPRTSSSLLQTPSLP